jgi:hypothetical protein
MDAQSRSDSVEFGLVGRVAPRLLRRSARRDTMTVKSSIVALSALGLLLTCRLGHATERQTTVHRIPNGSDFMKKNGKGPGYFESTTTKDVAKRGTQTIERLSTTSRNVGGQSIWSNSSSASEKVIEADKSWKWKRTTKTEQKVGSRIKLVIKERASANGDGSNHVVESTYGVGFTIPGTQLTPWVPVPNGIYQRLNFTREQENLDLIRAQNGAEPMKLNRGKPPFFSPNPKRRQVTAAK